LKNRDALGVVELAVDGDVLWLSGNVLRGKLVSKSSSNKFIPLGAMKLTKYQYAAATKKPPPTMLPITVGIMDFQM
jgi:hypothetical protein